MKLVQKDPMHAAIAAIAMELLRIETLETRNSDSLDFHERAVWNIRRALEEAYQAGRTAGRETEDSTEKETVRKMKRLGWTLTVTCTPGQGGYTASFRKTIEVQMPHRPWEHRPIAGESESLTMSKAIADASRYALDYERDLRKSAYASR